MGGRKYDRGRASSRGSLFGFQCSFCSTCQHSPCTCPGTKSTATSAETVQRLGCHLLASSGTLSQTSLHTLTHSVRSTGCESHRSYLGVFHVLLCELIPWLGSPLSVSALTFGGGTNLVTWGSSGPANSLSAPRLARAAPEDSGFGDSEQLAVGAEGAARSGAVTAARPAGGGGTRKRQAGPAERRAGRRPSVTRRGHVTPVECQQCSECPTWVCASERRRERPGRWSRRRPRRRPGRPGPRGASSHRRRRRPVPRRARPRSPGPGRPRGGRRRRGEAGGRAADGPGS